MQWFRFPHKSAHDLRLRRLPPAMRWCWVMVLTAASESPQRGWLLLTKDIPLTIEDLADIAGVQPGLMAQALALLLEYQLLESIDGVLHVTNWEETQFDSDSSTERSRKCRQKAKVATLPATLAATEMQRCSATDMQRCSNGPDTDTDSETDTETDTETPTSTDVRVTDAATPTAAPGVSLPLVSFPTRWESIGGDAEDVREPSTGRRKAVDHFALMLVHSP